MSEEKTEIKETTNSFLSNATDGIYNKILGYVTQKVQRFVAFLFLVLALGMLIGSMLTQHHINLGLGVTVIPAGLGLIAYYNRDFASVLFVLFLLFFLVIL